MAKCQVKYKGKSFDSQEVLNAIDGASQLADKLVESGAVKYGYNVYNLDVAKIKDKYPTNYPISGFSFIETDILKADKASLRKLSDLNNTKSVEVFGRYTDDDIDVLLFNPKDFNTPYPHLVLSKQSTEYDTEFIENRLRSIRRTDYLFPAKERMKISIIRSGNNLTLLPRTVLRTEENKYESQRNALAIANALKLKDAKNVLRGADKAAINIRPRQTRAEVERAKKKLQTMLGMTSDEVTILEEAIQDYGDRSAVARFTDDARIILTTFMEEGTEYHEAFHRVFRRYLTAEQRQKIYDEFLKRSDAQTLLEGQKELTPELTEEGLIEEILADEFRDYALSEQKDKANPEKSNFFQKLLKFLRELVASFFGPRPKGSNAEYIYKNILQGAYAALPMQPEDQWVKAAANSIQIKTTASKAIYRNPDGTYSNTRVLSAKSSEQLAKGITAELFRVLFFENGGQFNPMQLYDGTLELDKLFSVKTESGIELRTHIYNKLMIEAARVQRRLNEEVLDISQRSDLEAKKNDLISASQIWNSDEGFVDVLKYQLNYLETLGIELKSDDEIDSETEEYNNTDEKDEDQAGRDALFLQSAITYDPFDSVSRNIKLILATLVTKDADGNIKQNEMGLHEPLPLSVVYNNLAQTLARLPADPDIFFDAIDDLAEEHPELSALTELETILPKINTNSVSAENLDKAKLRYEFVQGFAKAFYDYYITKVRPKNGNIFSQDALFVYSTGVSIKEASSNLNANIKKYTEDGLRNQIVRTSNLLEVGHLLGFVKLTDSMLDQTYEQENGKVVTVSDAIKAIKNQITNIKSAPLSTLYEPSSPFDVRGTVQNIAAIIEATNLNPNLSHFNPDGQMVYSISLNTYMTLLADRMNFYRDTLENDLPYVLNSYSVNSVILNRVMDGVDFKINVAEGLSPYTPGQGKTTDQLTPMERAIQIFNDTLQGKYHFIQTGGRKTTNTFSIGGELFVKFPETSTYTFKALFDHNKTLFRGYLEDEVNTIIAHRNSADKFVNAERNKDKFRFFSFLEGRKEDIIRAMQDGRFNDLWESEIKDAVMSHLEQGTKDYMEYYTQLGAMEKYDGNPIGISREIRAKYGHNTTATVAMAYLNMVAGYIESTKIIFGDPAHFKDGDDVFKRYAMFNSTKSVSIVTTELNQLIDSLNKSTPIELDGDMVTYTKDVEPGYIKEAVVEEGETVSSQDFIDNLRENFLEQYTKDNETFNLGLSRKDIEDKVDIAVNAYQEYEESDGLSMINIFEWRELRVRQAQWGAREEAIFKKILDNKNLTADEMMYIYMEKPQYTGPVIYTNTVEEYKALTPEERLSVPAGRKTAYMVLIPQVVRGTNLEEIHNTMIREGIGVLHFTSAAKYGVKLQDDESISSFYAEDGSLNPDWMGNQSILDYRFLGLQAAIHQGHEKTIRHSTQSRKLNLINTHQVGQPLNDDFKQLTEDYIDIDNEIVQRELDYVLREIEAEKHTRVINNQLEEYYVINNYEPFVRVLEQMAIDRNVPANVLHSINYIIQRDQNGKYLGRRKLEQLHSKSRIEQILMAYVRNNIVRQKRYGRTLPQTSARGFESGSRDVLTTENQSRIQESKELKFYKKDGNKVQPMEAIIPLPPEMIGLATQLGDGSLEEGLELINEMLDAREDMVGEDNVETWRSLQKIKMFKALRIPNQAFASNEVGVVKKFSHPTFGAIVVPSQFVVKNGSDFDIDKMFMYINPFYVENGVLKTFDYNTSFTEEDRLERATVAVKHSRRDVERLTLLMSARLRTAQKYNETNEVKIAKDLLEKFQENRIEQNRLRKKLKQVLGAERHPELIGLFRALNKFDSKLNSIKYKETSDQIKQTADILELVSKIEAIDRKIDEKFEELGIISEAPDTKELNAKLGKLESSYSSQLAELFSVFGLTAREQLTRQALETRYLEIETKLLAHPEKYMDLMSPVTDVNFKRVANQVQMAKGITASGGRPLSSIFDPITNIKKFDNFAGGSKGIGIFAVNLTSHVLAQISGLKINTNFPGQQVFFEDHGGELGHIYDVKGNMISGTMNEGLSTQVDVEKYDYPKDLNLYGDALNVFIYLVRRGVDRDTALMFVSQPIITRFLHNQQNNRGVIVNTFGAIRKTYAEVILKSLKDLKLIGPYDMMNVKSDFVALNKNKTTYRLLGREGSPHPMITYDNMKDLMMGAMPAKYAKQLSIDVLDQFLVLKDQSRAMGEVVMNTSPDTQGDKSFSASKRAINNVKKLMDPGYTVTNYSGQPVARFENYDRYIGTTGQGSLLKPYQGARELQAGIGQDLTYRHDPVYSKVLDEMYSTLTKFMSPRSKEAERIRHSIDSDFALFMLVKSGFDSSQAVFDLTMKGQRSVPKRVQEIQNDATHPLHNNAFIQGLVPMVGNKSSGVDNMKLRDNNITTYDTNALISGFMDLSKAGEEGLGLAKDILRFSLYQSGFDYSGNSLHKALPSSFFSTVLGNGIGSNPITPQQMTEFQIEFFLNHPEYLKKYPHATEQIYGNLIFVPSSNSINYIENNKAIYKFKPTGDRQYYRRYGVLNPSNDPSVSIVDGMRDRNIGFNTEASINEDLMDAETLDMLQQSRQIAIKLETVSWIPTDHMHGALKNFVESFNLKGQFSSKTDKQEVDPIYNEVKDKWADFIKFSDEAKGYKYRYTKIDSSMRTAMLKTIPVVKDAEAVIAMGGRNDKEFLTKVLTARAMGKKVYFNPSFETIRTELGINGYKSIAFIGLDGRLNKDSRNDTLSNLIGIMTQPQTGSVQVDNVFSYERSDMYNIKVNNMSELNKIVSLKEQPKELKEYLMKNFSTIFKNSQYVNLNNYTMEEREVLADLIISGKLKIFCK